MSNEQLADLTQPQRDRLAFVELRVRFIGEIRRQALGDAVWHPVRRCFRDLALYKELAPATSTTTPRASPTSWAGLPAVFDFPGAGVVVADPGFGDGEPMRLKAWVASESPSRLTHPDLDAGERDPGDSPGVPLMASSTTPSPVAAPSGRSSRSR